MKAYILVEVRDEPNEHGDLRALATIRRAIHKAINEHELDVGDMVFREDRRASRFTGNVNGWPLLNDLFTSVMSALKQQRGGSDELREP